MRAATDSTEFSFDLTISRWNFLRSAFGRKNANSLSFGSPLKLLLIDTGFSTLQTDCLLGGLPDYWSRECSRRHERDSEPLNDSRCELPKLAHWLLDSFLVDLKRISPPRPSLSRSLSIRFSFIKLSRLPYLLGIYIWCFSSSIDGSGLASWTAPRDCFTGAISISLEEMLLFLATIAAAIGNSCTLPWCACFLGFDCYALFFAGNFLPLDLFKAWFGTTFSARLTACKTIGLATSASLPNLATGRMGERLSRYFFFWSCHLMVPSPT